LLVLAALLSLAAAAEAPDTVLVLKNGSEVRGVLKGIADGKVTMQLADGRTMTYESTDVERTERISAPAPAPLATPAVELQPCNIFLTEGTLDASLIVPMKETKLSKGWNGETQEMYIEFAEHLTKKLKADGATKVHTWKAPSGGSWNAPHIGGIPFTWTEAGRAAKSQLKGRCF
jgi:hypothetical protein